MSSATRHRRHRFASPPARRPTAHRTGRLCLWMGLVVLLILVVAGIVATMWVKRPMPQPRPAAAATARTSPRIPELDTSEMEPRVRQAIRQARAAVIAQPDSADVWAHLGKVLDAHHLRRRAALCYREALALEPNDFRLTYFLAIAGELREGGLNEAIVLFEKAAQLNSEYPPLYMRLGDAWLRLGRVDRARDAYLRSVELDADSAIGHRSVGQTLLSLGERAEAIKHLQRAAELAPDDGPVFGALAQAYARRGQLERAEEAAQRSRRSEATILLSDPIRREVLNLGISSQICWKRAQRFIQSGRYAGAITLLKITEETRADNPRIQTALGVCYARTGQQALASLHLRQAIHLDDEMGGAHAELGALLLVEERFDKAIHHLRRAAELAPDHAPAHARLALALAQSGNLTAAIAEFERAASLAELDARTHLNWGSALQQLGKIEAAMQQYRTAIELRPDYAAAYYNLGYVFEELGRIDEAIDHYQQAIRIEPGHRASEGLKRLLDADDH